MDQHTRKIRWQQPTNYLNQFDRFLGLALKGLRRHVASHKLLRRSTDTFICDALRDLVPFVKFKKREKHPWRSFTFNKVAG